MNEQPKDGGAAFEVGMTYDISHSRKGLLTIEVYNVDGEWVSAELISGHMKTANPDNKVLPGENFTFRAAFATIIAAREATQ